MNRLRLAIAGMTACSGCQLTLLNCEDELSQLLDLIEFHYFPLACSPALISGTYDAALVEGCLSTPRELDFIQILRKQSRILVALGTCAVWGGVAGLRNSDDRELLLQEVYGHIPDSLKKLPPPSPLSKAVSVDVLLSGCPPEKKELLSLLTGLTRNILPVRNDYPVCSECHMQENLCLLTGRNELCLGPLTLGGCNARCPTMGVPCEGCRGPVPEANMREMTELCGQMGYDRRCLTERLYRFSREW